MKPKINMLSLLALILTTFAVSAGAQTPEFNYQGNLKDGAADAEGTYQMRFSLYDDATGGTQVGQTIELGSVEVSEGVFSVSLDFGMSAFDGSTRYLQIEVRRNSGEAYVPLEPRQKIDSAPYSIRAVSAQNADQLGGVPSTEYVTDSSNGFIRNGTVPQTASFRISGAGRADIFNADSQFNLNGERIIGAPGTNNLFVGKRAGSSNTGEDNSFFGFEAGFDNTEGFRNSFFGYAAGKFNTTGFGNSFFGAIAGLANTSGRQNSFFGQSSGGANTSGESNSFFGQLSGVNNSSGDNNTFIGRGSGFANTTGSNNTLLGSVAKVGSADLSYATAIGAGAEVSTNNTIVLGRSNDRTIVSGELNVLAGASAPVDRGDVNFINSGGNFDFYMQGGNGTKGINFGVNSSTTNAVLFISQYDGTTYQDRLIISPTGTVEIRQLGTGGSTDLCRNAGGEVSTCSSSIRYKTGVSDFTGGLDIVKRLRPVSFNWKEGGTADLGLVAEEAAQVEKLLTTENQNGEVEGVKYDRLGVVLVNAVREQQQEIERQNIEVRSQKERIGDLQKIINEQNALINNQESRLIKQQEEIEALKELVCKEIQTASICQP